MGIKGIIASFLLLIFSVAAHGQQPIIRSELPSLPGGKGWAGMFAGVSDSILFCMGGANFPDQLPWKGGEKKWYADIYMLRRGNTWNRLKVKLPQPLGYGVSVSYHGDIILIGGMNADSVSRKVYACRWENGRFMIRSYPDLPVPLANMAGTLVKNIIIVAGGIDAVLGQPLRKCYGLDLEHLESGWFPLAPIPGSGRILAMCAAHQGKFFLFGGERSDTSVAGIPFRHILPKAYCFTPEYTTKGWSGTWRKLSPMPHGISAAATPLPVLKGQLFFWGGVDPLTALNTDPANPDAISKDMFLYDLSADTWRYLGKEHLQRPRVTLPTVYWHGEWVYVSGEVSAGVRTNTLVSVNKN